MQKMTTSPVVIWWASSIYIASTLVVNKEPVVNKDWSTPDSLYAPELHAVFDCTLETTGSYSMEHSPILAGTYAMLFDQYFGNSSEDAEFRAVTLNVGTLIGMAYTTVWPIELELGHQRWGFTEGKMFCKVSDFITGSAAEDFNQILDPKLLE